MKILVTGGADFVKGDFIMGAPSISYKGIVRI